MSDLYIPCFPQELPSDQLILAAADAIACNPANAVPELAIQHLDNTLSALDASETLTPQFLAVLTGKYWGPEGANLSVSFLEETSAELRNKILAHANAWSEHCNVKFYWSQSQGQIRITREQEGYWSFLGRDCLYIAAGKPTMCLSRFSLGTPESEYRRVVRHEFGHVLSFPHEHQLPQIVAELDPEKTIAWAWRQLGWTAAMVRQQILTPLDPRSLRMTANADKAGIMCYMLPGEITRSGRPIPGGADIDAIDAQFAGQIYPKPTTKPVEPAKPSGGGMSDFLKTFLLGLLKNQLEQWLKDGTLQKWLEELLKKLASGQVQNVAQLEVAAAQAYETATTV